MSHCLNAAVGCVMWGFGGVKQCNCLCEICTTQSQSKICSYRLDKLVRDKSVSTMEEDDVIVQQRRLSSDEEFAEQLNIKIREEWEEVRVALAADNAELIKEETADMFAVLDAMLSLPALPANTKENIASILDCIKLCAALHSITIEEINAAREFKRMTRGEFADRIFVSTISCYPGSKWDLYCQQDPKKYSSIG